jgi:uncharacterized protein YciI
VALFAVFRERASAWDVSRPIDGQAAWPEHAAFMDALADEGSVVAGGPLGDGFDFLLIFEAGNENTIRARLAGDPWMAMNLLEIARIEPWQIVLGEPLSADMP